MKNGDRPINVALKLLDYETEGVHGEDLVGLTKREYFAAMAMQGIMARYTGLASLGSSTLHYSKMDEEIARESVSIADALLAELDKTE